MNFIKENSYLKIIHEGTEEIIKLDFREDMSNNHFFYNENSNSINLNKDVLRQSGDIDILNIENYFKDNFQYDRKNRQYHKQIRTKEKSIDIYYSIDTYNITIFEKYNNKDIQISYNLTTGIIEYDENFSLKTITKKFIYDTKNNKCIFDVCDENIVEKILNNYLNNFIDYGKKK